MLSQGSWHIHSILLYMDEMIVKDINDESIDRINELFNMTDLMSHDLNVK